MQIWELLARESIRDLVARYNSNGDSGRFSQVLDLFATDATMDIDDGHTYRGRDEIATIFTRTKDAWGASAADRATPRYVRHCVATHQIDVADTHRARGRCYFFVIMHHGLDHWGRYLDEYAEIDGTWLFISRTVRIDGRRTQEQGARW